MTTQEPIPKVSVCVISYNHGKYIRECLQSILDQETDFEFEIIVGDDCSSDATRAIVLELKNQYPGKIKPIFYEEKVGGTRNYLTVHSAAQGQYIAHVDGDDLCLPGKLQYQVDYLDRHSDVALAAHAVNLIIHDQASETRFGQGQPTPTRATLEDLLLLGTYFTNSSIMYRSVNRFPHSLEKDYVDFYFHLEQASKGVIYHDDRVLGSYRVHDKGISKDSSQKNLLYRCYEDAFDRASELGVPFEIVQRGRLRRRMAFAIERYLSNDADGYLSCILLNDSDLKYASMKHKFLFYTKKLPLLIDTYFMTNRVFDKIRAALN